MPVMIVLRHALYDSLPHFIVGRDGRVTGFGRPSDGQTVNIILDGGLPLLPAADGRFYPARNSGSGFVPDMLRPPVTYFYEYCRQNRWRGFIYYERYGTSQLAALDTLLRDLCREFGITRPYGRHTWQPCPERTAAGAPGIYTDASFSTAGPAVHPQPELLTMLKQL